MLVDYKYAICYMQYNSTLLLLFYKNIIPTYKVQILKTVTIDIYSMHKLQILETLIISTC